MDIIRKLHVPQQLEYVLQKQDSARVAPSKECRELQEEQVASFFQAYFGPICRLVISPEIVVIRVKSQSLFMVLGQISDKPSNKYQN